VKNLKEYRTVASSSQSSVKIRIFVFETRKITEKKEKDNIECARVRKRVKKIISGRRNPDRFCIERRGARCRYVAKARSLICDPEKYGYG